MISATLDSNVFISALQFGGAGARLLGMAKAGLIQFDTSDAILDETIGVLRDKFGWEGYRLHFARLELMKLTNVATPTESVTIVYDHDDNKIIECAIAAGSDYIVTNDNAVLRVGEYRGIRMVSVADFLGRGRQR